MMFQVIYSDVFTKTQKMFQRTQSFFFGLILDGVEYFRLYDPDGRPAAELTNRTLFLIPPEFGIDFSYNEDRKNYVVICKSDDIFWEKESGTLVYPSGSGQINLPLFIDLNQMETAQYQEIFQRITSLSKSPFPADNQAGEFLLYSIFSRFLEVPRRNPGYIPSVLKQLKNKIDSDLRFQFSLRQIMEGLPISQLHLRRLFHQYYQTSPMEYRTRLRIARIRELLQSDLNFKEIADEVGMKNVTHLYSFLNKQYGMTPAELRSLLKMQSVQPHLK